MSVFDVAVLAAVILGPALAAVTLALFLSLILTDPENDR